MKNKFKIFVAVFILLFILLWRTVVQIPVTQAVVAQSVQVTSGNPTVTLPAGAPWNNLGSSGSSSRWEVRLHNFGNAPWNFNYNVGPMRVYIGNGNQLLITNASNPPVTDQLIDPVPGVIQFNNRSDILIRLQRDVVNMQYTLELCDTTGGNCSSNSYHITSLGQTSWSGFQNIISPGYQMEFMRWFSTAVPVGTVISTEGAVGDLGDWEFEGNLNDSSGHGLTMSGGSISYSTSQIFPPSCSAGIQQTFKIGQVAQLDGTNSQALDGTSLTYSWVQTTSQSISLSSNTSPSPTFNTGSLVSGPVNFTLTVTDGSGQPTSCSVHDGAVVTDSNNVVQTGNPNVDTLIGPQIAFGNNPWPWFDDRNKKLADLQMGAMDTNYPDFWDTVAGGTVSISPSQNCGGSAAGACLVGSGTNFTSTFSPGSLVVVWWNNGANRVMNSVQSVIDNTHLILTYPLGTGTTEALLNYSAPTNIGAWGYAMVSTPGNYYDNVEAYYALYYRTGIDTYLNAAHTLADRFWRSPMMDQGQAFLISGVNTETPNVGFGYRYAIRSASLTGMVLRALEQGGSSAMWAGLRTISMVNVFSLRQVGTNISYYGLQFDQRDLAYTFLYTAYCGLFDPNITQRTNCQTAISDSFASHTINPAGFWQIARAPDGSFPTPEFMTMDTAHSVTVTNGSTILTGGSGTNWTTGQINGNPVALYHNFSVTPPNDNSSFDTSIYHPSVSSPTQLTLDRPFSGPSGTYGLVVGTAAYGVIGWGNQPFMEGIQTVAFVMAAKAISTSDPTTSDLAYSYASGLANWLKTYGYSNPSNGGVGGMHYFTNFINCSYPMQTTLCTAGFTASQARTDAAETVRGMSLAYAQNGDTSLKSFIDTVYSQMYSKPGTGALLAGDGQYITDLDDGQTFMSSGGLANKWLGFFFGFDNGASWPAMRLVSITPPPDTTPPVLSSVSSSALTQTTAAISWTTDEAADTQIDYGTTTSYGSSTALNTTLALTHTVSLSSLTAGTLYHFRVKSRDLAGNIAVSADQTLTTTAVVVQGGGGGGGGGGSPSFVSFSNVVAVSTTTTTALISWQTVGSSVDSYLDYGTSTAYALTASSTVLTQSHSIFLTNLLPNTLHHFRVRISSGTASSDFTFTSGQGTSVMINPAPTPTSTPTPTPTPLVINLKLINNNGTYYLIDHNVRHGITNPGMLSTYGFSFIDAKTATLQENSLPEGGILTPSDGALVKSKEDQTVYLISKQQRYAFTSATVFLALGFKFSSVLLVTNPELQQLAKAENISNSNQAHLPGSDISINGQIDWVGYDNQLHPYPNLAIYNSWHIIGDFSTVLIGNDQDKTIPVGSVVSVRAVE